MIALGSRPENSSKLPRLIYLVGHYTKADVPAFSDFKDIKQVVSAVRGSFVTVDMDSALSIDFPDGDDVELRIQVLSTPTCCHQPVRSHWRILATCSGCQRWCCIQIRSRNAN